MVTEKRYKYTRYECEMCGHRYGDREDAERCEKRELVKSEIYGIGDKWDVGDVVFVFDHENTYLGVISGKRQYNHFVYPAVGVFGGEEPVNVRSHDFMVLVTNDIKVRVQRWSEIISNG